MPSLRLRWEHYPDRASCGRVEAVKRSVTVNPMALGVLPLRPGLPPVLLEARAHRTRPPAHPAIAELIELLRTTLSGRPERQLGTV